MDDPVHRQILENLHEAVYFVDPRRRIQYWNPAAEELTGFVAQEVVGHFCHDNILQHIDEQGRVLCFAACPLSEAMTDGKPRQAKIYLHHKEGHRIPVWVRASPVRDEKGQIIGAVESFQDASPLRVAQEHIEELRSLALLDPLTHLPNRRYLEITLAARLREMQRYGWKIGVLFADLDEFKRVNDSYGHEIGDRTLRMVGETLERSVRSFDTVGRWGGEEFVAVLVKVDRQGLASIAERSRILVEESRLRLKPKPLGVTLSIGATLATAEDTPQSLVHRADKLMYRSKLQGRNGITIG
jgi:diguanylate cyclase (GGDEF)-like protein/PAS domain S-box-containing protein